mmetsp:Transcript_39668/g.124661  ORF Transcript_39668/g.124661 Transcript_39668/m.124661 type:complete len:500 (-) Transcript_39668:212-1711(-)
MPSASQHLRDSNAAERESTKEGQAGGTFRSKANVLSGQPDMEALAASLQARDCMNDNRMDPGLGSGFLPGEERVRQLTMRRQNCMWTFIFAILGVVLAVTDNEIRWDSLDDFYNVTKISFTLRVLVVTTTILTLYFLYKYYETLINLRRLSGIRLPPGVSISSLKGGGYWSQFLIDVLIMLPQPLPLLDVNVTIWNKGLGRASIYELNSILCCLMFVRFFYVPRFYGECISDLQSESTVALGRMNRVKIDESFILKYVIANSMQVVIVLTLLQIVMFAYMMMVFERVVDNGALQHFANCVWLTIITMTTVGYGDEFPTTLLGRMVSVMASIVAVVMLAITVNLVIAKLTLSRAESKVIAVMDKITLRKDLKHKAAVVIQRWIRAHKEYMEGERRGSTRGGYMMIPDFKSARRKNMDLRAQVLSNLPLLESINDFKETSDESFSNNLQTDVPELVGNLSSQLVQQEKRILELNKKAEEVNNLVAKLLAKKKQDTLQRSRA